MRDANRIGTVLEAIERIWRLHPDWRLGQLVCNVAAWVDPTQEVIWDLEDDVLVKEIERHLEQANLRLPTNGEAVKNI
jgi:uncharacterized protein YihD (DUF1040 family)